MKVSRTLLGLLVAVSVTPALAGHISLAPQPAVQTHPSKVEVRPSEARGPVEPYESDGSVGHVGSDQVYSTAADLSPTAIAAR